jgi:ATP/maltotriose-dependent transcriptional regulator MalT
MTCQPAAMPGTKAHLRSIYQKLGVTSRSQAIERAVDLRRL